MLASALSSVSRGLLYRQQLYFLWDPSTAVKYSVGTCASPGVAYRVARGTSTGPPLSQMESRINERKTHAAC